MKHWSKWAVGGLVVALLVTGTVRTLAARKARQAELESQQTAQRVQVSVDLLPADLIQVQMLDIPLNIAISGTVKAVNTAQVKARVPGELQGLTVREGDLVKVGQILAHIDATESQARHRQALQQAQAAKAQVDIAQRSYDNNRALVAQGFISSTTLETSQASLAAALASFSAAQSGADLTAKTLDDTVLRAPIAGQISQRLAQPGERLAIDTRVVEIVDLSHLELEAALNAADALQVKLGQVAQLRIEGMTQTISARVARINPSATTGSRAVMVYLSINPGTALHQGLFAEGQLEAGMLHTLAIPLTAVRTDKPQPYVQVLDKNQVQHVNVNLGARSEVNSQTLVAITGVSENTNVISGTVGSLRAGTRVTPPRLEPKAP